MKKRLLSVITALAIALGAFGTQTLTLFGGASATAQAATAVETPKSNIASGSYTVPGAFKVILTCPTEGATIYYKVNNYDWKEYKQSVSITQNTTLKIYAKKNGVSSAVATYTYQLTPNMAVVAASDSTDTNQRIVIRSNVPAIQYYYTLDGTTPTTSSKLYTMAGINITKTSTLTVLAVRNNWNSRIITKTITVKGSTTTPEKHETTEQPTTPSSSTGTAVTGNASILNDYAKKWGYNQLTASQKKAYARIYSMADYTGESASLSDLGIKTSELEKIYWAFDYDNPQFLALGSGFGYSYNSATKQAISISITYGRSKSEISAIQKQFDSTAQSVIAKAKTYSSDYDRLKYIHDWVVSNTDYISSGPAYKSEADGPIVYGKALCEGYSKAFMYLAQSMGYECVCIVGKANGGAHMWNMVKIGNRWYHVDTTFDDPIMSDGSRVVRHTYFLVSDSAIKRTHTISNPFAVPSAPVSY